MLYVNGISYIKCKCLCHGVTLQKDKLIVICHADKVPLAHIIIFIYGLSLGNNATHRASGITVRTHVYELTAVYACDGSVSLTELLNNVSVGLCKSLNGSYEYG